MTKTAIEAAQAIVDSISDVRPELAGKRVTALWTSPPTEPLTVRVWFSDGGNTNFYGTWAEEIVRHLPERANKV